MKSPGLTPRTTIGGLSRGVVPRASEETADVCRGILPLASNQPWQSRSAKEPETMIFKRIDHVEIVTDQLDRTEKFYTEVLGFAVKIRDRIERSGLGVPIELVYLDLGGTVVELTSSGAREFARLTLGRRSATPTAITSSLGSGSLELILHPVHDPLCGSRAGSAGLVS